jgi:hypothetical protein
MAGMIRAMFCMTATFRLGALSSLGAMFCMAWIDHRLLVRAMYRSSHVPGVPGRRPHSLLAMSVMLTRIRLHVNTLTVTILLPMPRMLIHISSPFRTK